MEDESGEVAYLEYRRGDALEAVGAAVQHLKLGQPGYLRGEGGELVAVEVKQRELLELTQLGRERGEVVARQHQLPHLSEGVDGGGEVTQVGLAQVHH